MIDPTVAALRLDARRKVWISLSDLFLDREMRCDLPRIARELAASGFTRAQLERILAYEVIPEFGWNLLCFMGEWALLDVNEESLVRRATSMPGRLSRWRWAAAASMVAPSWRTIMALYDLLWTMTEPMQHAYATAWGFMAHEYIERSTSPRRLAAYDIESLRDCGLSRDDCLRTARRHFLPAYDGVLVADERIEQEEREARVIELVYRAFALGGNGRR
jgi:uncharacterized protein YjiS (DUF1127 family)